MIRWRVWIKFYELLQILWCVVCTTFYQHVFTNLAILKWCVVKMAILKKVQVKQKKNGKVSMDNLLSYHKRNYGSFTYLLQVVFFSLARSSMNCFIWWTGERASIKGGTCFIQISPSFVTNHQMAWNLVKVSYGACCIEECITFFLPLISA